MALGLWHSVQSTRHILNELFPGHNWMASGIVFIPANGGLPGLSGQFPNQHLPASYLQKSQANPMMQSKGDFQTAKIAITIPRAGRSFAATGEVKLSHICVQWKHFILASQRSECAQRLRCWTGAETDCKPKPALLPSARKCHANWDSHLWEGKGPVPYIDRSIDTPKV